MSVEDTPESLLGRGKVDAAIDAFKRMARLNSKGGGLCYLKHGRLDNHLVNYTSDARNIYHRINISEDKLRDMVYLGSNCSACTRSTCRPVGSDSHVP